MVWFYIILFAIFLIIEGMTFNLVTIWMAMASLITSVYAWFFPYRYGTQVVIFTALSIILIIATKPLLKKFVPKPVRTNADGLVGEIGIVTVAIDKLSSSGQVKIKGQIWSAKCDSDDIICENEKVKIIKIEGVKLVVEPV